MEKKMFIVIFILVAGCTGKSKTDNADHLISQLQNYLEARTNRDSSYWEYTADTVTTWFDEKKGNGSKRIKGVESSGPWTEWDKEMNSYSTHDDSLKVDLEEQSVTGIFYEHNDFYDLIGRAPSKTTRTYWFNEKELIKEVLIVWDTTNILSSVYLKPVVNWAMTKDSTEIQELYPKGEIIPSGENARRWKKLLTKYNESLK